MWEDLISLLFFNLISLRSFRCFHLYRKRFHWQNLLDLRSHSRLVGQRKGLKIRKVLLIKPSPIQRSIVYFFFHIYIYIYLTLLLLFCCFRHLCHNLKQRMVTCLCNVSISYSFKQCFFICASSTMQHNVSLVFFERTFQWNILHLHFLFMWRAI
jgi:hypothetical protein